MTVGAYAVGRRLCAVDPEPTTVRIIITGFRPDTVDCAIDGLYPATTRLLYRRSDGI